MLDTYGSSSTTSYWAYGIYHSGHNGLIRNNRVSGVDNSDPIFAEGILSDKAGSTSMIIENWVTDTQICIGYNAAMGVIRDNTVSGCAVNYTGATDGGGNYPSP